MNRYQLTLDSLLDRTVCGHHKITVERCFFCKSKKDLTHYIHWWNDESKNCDLHKAVCTDCVRSGRASVAHGLHKRGVEYLSLAARREGRHEVTEYEEPAP